MSVVLQLSSWHLIASQLKSSADFVLIFVRNAAMSVQCMSMTTARIAPELVITAPNNAERWPPEKKIKLPNPLRRFF